MGGEIDIISIDKSINYPLAKLIAPILFNLGIIPNYITILNVFLRLSIIYITLNYSNQNTLIYYLISHFLDCLDGTLARMFNLQTKFGAELDHISDKIFWGFLIINSILICRRNKVNRNIILMTFILILIGLYNCNFKNNCDAENIVDMNAMVLIIIVNSLHNKCIN